MKNRVRYKKNYDKKTKDQLFNNGDKFLVTPPTNSDKHLMQWIRPYQYAQLTGDQVYKILVGNMEKIHHVNMLKKYYAQEDKAETDISEKKI